MAEQAVSQLKDLKKPKKPVAVPYTDLIRRAVIMKKLSEGRWGTSKHLASRHYPAPSARRASKKMERQNRKAGRS